MRSIISPRRHLMWFVLLWVLTIALIAFHDDAFRALATTRVDNLDATGEVLARGHFRITSSTGPEFLSGAADPTGVVTAPSGSIYLRTSNGLTYQNTNSATAWQAPISSLPTTTCGSGTAVTAISATGTATCTAIATQNTSAAITATIPIANTETVIVSFDAPANTLTAGTTILFQAGATQTGTGAANPIWRFRIGPTTLTGAVIVGLTGASNAAASDVVLNGSITIRSTGATGTAVGMLSFIKHTVGTGANGGANGVVTIDTTVTNHIELTAISSSGAVTYNMFNGYLARVR